MIVSLVRCWLDTWASECTNWIARKLPHREKCSEEKRDTDDEQSFLLKKNSNNRRSSLQEIDLHIEPIKIKKVQNELGSRHTNSFKPYFN